MWILLGFVLQIVVIVAGVRNEQRAGLWSWSKFAFTLGFAGLECAILIGPVSVMNPAASYFIPVYVACCVLAALNFVWFIIAARRWKLPDGRTSLQAYRDEKLAEKVRLASQTERR
jgi:hypothetical protein